MTIKLDLPINEATFKAIRETVSLINEPGTPGDGETAALENLIAHISLDHIRLASAVCTAPDAREMLLIHSLARRLTADALRLLTFTGAY